MKICLPVLEDNGIESSLSGHFGSAPYFLFVDTQTLETESLLNTNQNHSHGMCQPLAVIGAKTFDAIVVSGIGAGALNKLKSAGKKVFKTEYSTIKETINAINTGKLSEFSLNSACSHNHDEGHDCGHDHAPHGVRGFGVFRK